MPWLVLEGMVELCFTLGYICRRIYGTALFYIGEYFPEGMIEVCLHGGIFVPEGTVKVCFTDWGTFDIFNFQTFSLIGFLKATLV